MEEYAFTVKIQQYIKEIGDFKEKHSNLWKPEYDRIKSTLLDITETYSLNPSQAEDDFDALPISRYETFEKYVSDNDVTAVSEIKTNTERIRTKRNRRMKACPNCGSPITTTNGKIYCKMCGTIRLDGTNSPNSRVSCDNSKHIHKQLDSLTGTRKPPANIEKIINYIVIWLTDLRYIHDYLLAESRKTLEDWKEKYMTLTSQQIEDYTFFNRTLERIPNNAWEYRVFKLFMEPFYKLLDVARRYSREGVSNVDQLSDDDIIKLFESYISENGNRKPREDEIYHDYEVGKYILKLSLICDTPEDHIKNRMDKLFNTNLTIPGLMFNFEEVYNRNDNVPKRYNYQQEYIYIMHEAFHVEYVNIPTADKQAIVELVQQFNEFYKAKYKEETSQKKNSPLYCCVLARVFKLPRFQRYAQVCKYIPKKDKNTEDHISLKWFQFTIKNDLSKYLSTKDEVFDDFRSSVTGMSQTVATETQSEADPMYFNYDDDCDDSVF